jgi:amino acid permease
MFVFDFKLGIPLALGLTLVPPLILAVSNYITFMQIMETLGIVIGGISGLLIVLMFWKAKKYGDRKPEYTLPDNRLVGIVLFLLFAVGAIYSLFMG